MRLFESLDNLLLTKYAKFNSIKRINSFSWNRRVKISCSTRLRESTIKNLRELLENHSKNSQIKNISLINNILFWRLNTWSYVFINTVEHHHSLDLVLSSNFIMSKRSSIKERFKEFQSRFFQISDADSSKLSSAESFINEDDESFAETVISFVSIENWKTQCMILDRETDQLNELSKQQDNEIKELKTKLQTKEITSSDFIYSERSRSQKIPDSFWFTDKKNSTWENWYDKIQNKLEINVDLFSNEQVKLSYVHFRLFNDAADVAQSRRERDCVNLYKIVDDLLKELAELFNDSDKKVNFCRKYYNLIQESKKFSEFYTQFQQLSFYLKYHEKQLIVDLKDKINLHLRFVWIDQLVQSDSLKKIHFYLIHLNNDQRVIWKIKNKVNLIKCIDDLSKIIFHKAVVTQSVNHSKSDHLKSRDAILTSVKKADVLVEICFICHKSDHNSRECSDWSTRINAVNNEYDHFEFNFNFDFNSKN